MNKYNIDFEDLGWASGFFEGEGCITQYAVPAAHLPKLTAVSTDFDTLERFHRAIGGIGKIRDHKVMQPHYKPQRLWTVSGYKGCQAVICLLWDGLGQRRKLRAKEVLSEYLEHKRKGYTWKTPYKNRGK